MRSTDTSMILALSCQWLRIDVGGTTEGTEVYMNVVEDQMEE